MSPRTVIAAAAIGASFALGAALSTRAPASQEKINDADFQAVVNSTMGLVRSQIVDLPIDTTPGRAVVVQVPIDGQLLTLDLVPHSIRSDQYALAIQIEDGSLVNLDPGPLRTMRGSIVEMPGSLVAGSVLDDGLHASIMLDNGDHYWLEPIARHVEGAQPQQHVLYLAGDALCDGVCGVNAMHNHAEQLRGAGPTTIGTEVCKIALLAVDADFQYYQQFGSSVTNVENHINNIINTINAQYQEQCGIIHEITQIIVRTSSASNPYSTNGASQLLQQFRNHWNNNHGNIPRNVAHLFTGRNLSGSTIGIAYLGVICNVSSAYGLSQHLGNFSCMTDLTAHEIGHNWNAGHCSCPSSTMNSSLTCANDFNSGSINQIVGFRNTRWCLTDCPPPGPTNNLCSGTWVVGPGQTPFSNVGATTDGPSEAADCTFFGDGNIQSDVWFGHIVQCTGDLTISLCESSFNAKLAVYDFPCPTQPGTVIACDVNSCPATTRGQVTIPVVQGQALRIRVGGHNGAQGNGILDIFCDPIPVCQEDLNGDSVVDVSDLLILLSEWGPCVGDCSADINSDGVVDVSDLLILLSAWGDC